MAVKYHHTQRRKEQLTALGMSRFYSQANLDRYRKLASGITDGAEQHKLLMDLAEEMNAFKREVRSTLSSSRRLHETPEGV
jgi:hypothetical protein